MINTASAVKVTLEINQETNLEELMAHLCLMQNNMPSQTADAEELLSDFSIHEGELAITEQGFLES